MANRLLLDFVLPGADGIELMRDVMAAGDVPVILASAYGQDQLVARAFKAVGDPGAAGALCLRDLVIDYAQRLVTVAGSPMPITAIEYRMLLGISANAGRVLTYEHLLQRVWGAEGDGVMRPMRTLVRNLRRKLGDDADEPAYIANVPRVGYRMRRGRT